MDLTTKTSRELRALHSGYNADALATIAMLDTMAPTLHELAGQPARRDEYHVFAAEYEMILGEARTSQAKGLEVYAEITRRCGMDEPTQTSAKGGTTGNGTRYCRTCGFTDCPGATSGNCPRWPARDEQDMTSNA